MTGIKIAGLKAVRLPNREIVLIGREGDNLTLTIRNDSLDVMNSDSVPPYMKIDLPLSDLSAPGGAVPPGRLDELINSCIRQIDKHHLRDSSSLVWDGAGWQPEKKTLRNDIRFSS